MAAIAHNPAFAKRVGVAQSVGRDFNQADAGTGILSKRAEGGRLNGLSDLRMLDLLINSHGEKDPIPPSRPLPGGGAAQVWTRPYQGKNPMSEPYRTVPPPTGNRFADGGGSQPPSAPWYERGAVYRMNRVAGTGGFLHSGIPGRTDKLNLNVAPGSYVVPADTVSHIGQNNSVAGGKILNNMFNMRGTNLMLKGRPRMGRMFMADGGSTGGKDAVPILAAGGEFVITPDVVAELGGGDMKKGHAILDRFVLSVRQKHIHTLKALPKPKT